MFISAICCFAFMIIQNVYFFVCALYKSKKECIPKGKMKSNILSSVVFSILPAFSLSLTLVPLIRSLGRELIFIRSIFTGSVQDNILAAETILNTFNLDLNTSSISPNVFVTVFWGMSLSGVSGLILIGFLSFYNKKKKILKSCFSDSAKIKDNKMIKILKMSFELFGKLLYVGVIGVYFVKQIAAEGTPEIVGDGAGFLSLITVCLSGGLVLLFSKVGHKRVWLRNLSVPLSMLLAFAVIVLLSLILPENIVKFEWRN